MFEKLEFAEAEQVAKLVGFDFGEYVAECGAPWFINNLDFFYAGLLTHIYCMVNEWEPLMRWEDLPSKVVDWYEETIAHQRAYLIPEEASRERVKVRHTPSRERNLSNCQTIHSVSEEISIN